MMGFAIADCRFAIEIRSLHRPCVGGATIVRAIAAMATTAPPPTLRRWSNDCQAKTRLHAARLHRPCVGGATIVRLRRGVTRHVSTDPASVEQRLSGYHSVSV